jgi:hypothetical protein
MVMYKLLTDKELILKAKGHWRATQNCADLYNCPDLERLNAISAEWQRELQTNTLEFTKEQQRITIKKEGDYYVARPVRTK